MTQITTKLSTKWIKASVLGTVWASSEIILGSFLHNLKIPFSGNILTAIALIILIATSYRWREKGIIWRSGVICALLKTMSPSAVIFGPMVAIFTEAVLLELSTRLFGRTVVGFLVGAALASSWILVQKIANYIIFYGMNIVEVYESMMKYAERQLNWQFDAVWTPILALLVLYVLFGMFAAIIGMRTGRKLQGEKLDFSQFDSSKKTAFFQRNSDGFNYSLAWLFINLGNMLTVLVLNNKIPFYVWTIYIMVIATVWAVRYKRALRQLMRPKFWLFFVVITMLTTFVFTSMQDKSWIEGVQIGVEMNLRAIILIMGFTVLGTELYNPKIRDYFARSNFKQLSLSLELSLESLPMMLKNMPELKTMLRNPMGMVAHVVAQSEWRLQQIEDRATENRFYIVSGGIAEGKTRFLETYIKQLKSENQVVIGFVAPRILENGNTVGYKLRDIEKSVEIPFMHTKECLGCEKIGKFYIDKGSFERGKAILENSLLIEADWIVMDEIGKLELQGKGWADMLKRVIAETDSNILVSVRKDFVEDVIESFFKTKVEILNC